MGTWIEKIINQNTYQLETPNKITTQLFYLIGKEKILLKEKKLKQNTRFTIVNKKKRGKKNSKQALSYPKRQKKIRDSRTIREALTPSPIKEGPSA